MNLRLSRGRGWFLLLAGLLLLAWAARQLTAPSEGVTAITEAFEARRSGVWVEAEGRVKRLLADDLEGSPHQRLILQLDGGHTLLIVHNIDLAERVPVEPGDQLAFRGRYEWNDRGGLVHWTHDDPDGRHAGGWLRHRGRIYR